MTPEQLTAWLHAPLADRLVLTLAHFLWQGSLVAIAVLALGTLCGKQINRRYAVSVCGLLALVILPVLTFAIIDRDVRTTDATPIGESVALEATMYDDLPRPSAGIVAESFDGLGRPSYEGELLSSASPWVLAAWLVGVTILTGRLLLSVASISWLKNTGEVAGELLREQARTLSARLNIRTPVVRVSRQVSQAIAVGFFRPVIVIPTAWLIQLPPECLEAVIAHELAHIRRCDLWINFLQRIVETLLFFHPAVWWLSARLRQEREMCCDELAVSLTGRRVEYASTLELVARRRGAAVAPVLAAGIGGRKMALLNRVRNILGLAPANTGVGPWTLGAAALVAGAGAWWLATGGSPLNVFAGEDDESSLVALADGEEGEREEGDGDRDRNREEGERRDGDRERDEGEVRRDGDREREGERNLPRDGDREVERDRPSPEQVRRHIEELKGRMRALAEQGRHEEAERVEQQIREIVQRFERGDRPDGERREGEHRESDRPRPDIHPEIRAHLEQLHRQLREADEEGREDEAHALERKIGAIHERLRAQHEGEGDRPRGEGEVPLEVRRHLEFLHRALREAEGERREKIENEIREIHAHLREHHGERGEREGERDRPRPDVSPRDRELIEVIQALREEVGRLRQEVNQLKGRGEGDRPRFDAHPPVERDRPRVESDRPRREGEVDRPRETDRPRERDVPREGDDRE